MWWRHDEQSLLLAWSIHKYGGMGQSVWLSSLAIQPENGKSCFFLSFATISSFSFFHSIPSFVCLYVIHS
jgi:hypothetical protein